MIAWCRFFVVEKGELALRPPKGEAARLDPLYCVLRSTYLTAFVVDTEYRPSPRALAAILARLRAEDVDGAVLLAEARLRAGGYSLKAPVRRVATTPTPRALAAALVLPLPWNLERDLFFRIVEHKPSVHALKETSHD